MQKKLLPRLCGAFLLPSFSGAKKDATRAEQTDRRTAAYSNSELRSIYDGCTALRLIALCDSRIHGEVELLLRFETFTKEV